jgi:hypothetical protein
MGLSDRQISRLPVKTIHQETLFRVRRFGDLPGASLDEIRKEGMRNPDPEKCHVRGGRYNKRARAFSCGQRQEKPQ